MPQSNEPTRIEKIKWRPMPGKIACQIVGERDTYGSGLLIKPPRVQNPRTTAKVIAVYEPFMLHPESSDRETESYVKVGDIVIFGMHSGIGIEYGQSETVIILREQEILCIVEADDDTIAATGVAGEDYSDMDEADG